MAGEKKERLDKIFSNLGILSRSECREAAGKGKITVNGVVCKKTDVKVCPKTDVIELEGKLIDSSPLVYYMLNKPEGTVTANEDPEHKTVFDLIDDRRAHLSAVGRLDRDTTGILIITNDGGLNHDLLSPRHHVPKRYEARLSPLPDAESVSRLENGIDIGDETPTLPAKIEIIDEETAAITITEGRYHQVKRMFAAVGCRVLKLHRTDFGPLRLDEKLAPGEYRPLSTEEIGILKAWKQ